MNELIKRWNTLRENDAGRPQICKLRHRSVYIETSRETGSSKVPLLSLSLFSLILYSSSVAKYFSRKDEDESPLNQQGKRFTIHVCSFG